MPPAPETTQAEAAEAKVPIFEWSTDGASSGVGAQVEFEHWRAGGVLTDIDTLGQIIGYESAKADERRKVAWAWPDIPVLAPITVKVANISDEAEFPELAAALRHAKDMLP